ncbi:MAG TPA: zinc ribbon domain-containing protein [Candidatus Aquilonibacter sp.]|jgi:hypothetical protein|nr:zinc ribbon domain-containing protein [Candidatus Aquilonibacter sp.]
MAFCNSCGAALNAGTRFCNKCGVPILASTLPGAAPTATPPAVAAPPVPAPGNNSALKVILVIAGVIVFLGILGVASAGFFAWHMAHHAHIHQDGDNVKVDTPFGSVETTKDPAEAARNLGVDLYPGAEVMKNGSATASFGGVHTSSLRSETPDSVDKVSSFYKTKFPNAMVTTSESGRCTIISNEHNSMVTINIESAGGKTKIQITNVRKATSDSSSN